MALNGKPLILHTLEAFYRYSSAIGVILVLPGDQLGTWHELAERYAFASPLTVQSGGTSRFQSVKRGLEKIQGEGLVAIHDGVRPLVSSRLIAESFRHAAVHQSAICAVPLKDSLRVLDSSPEAGRSLSKTRAVDRAAFRLIQTPQTFNVTLIKEAYRMAETPETTDDAAVFERAGHDIFLFDGSYDNIKITTPEDLVVAEALLRYRQL